MQKEITNRHKAVINRFKKLTFKEYNEMNLLLKYGNITEAAKIIDITHNGLKYTLTFLSKYDNLLLNSYNNHKKNSTIMLLQKQSQDDINRVKKSYNNIQNIYIENKKSNKNDK